MKFLSDKAKQFLTLLIKISVVCGAFYFIYNRLSSSPNLDTELLLNVVTTNENMVALSLLVLLTFLNRFVEILKWKNLASLISPVSTYQAAKQVLSALTLGIFTPNGIGEYAGKALYFDKNQTGRVIFLNLVCNGIQVIYALTFGILGITILNQFVTLIPSLYLLLTYTLILFTGILLFRIKNFSIKGYSLQTLFRLLNEIPKKTHRKNIFLALIRYLSFTHQYVILYYLFGVELPYFELLCAISTIYLLASSLPNFQFLEFAVKGSIALYIFSVLGVNQWVIILVATLIWFLNIVIPVSIGSIFVLTYKINRNQGD